MFAFTMRAYAFYISGTLHVYALTYGCTAAEAKINTTMKRKLSEINDQFKEHVMGQVEMKSSKRHNYNEQ